MSLTLVIILAYTVAVPAGVGLYFYKSLPDSLKSLSILFSIATAVEILSTIFRTQFQNNLIVINAYVIIEAWLCLEFVGYCIDRRRVLRFAQLLILGIGVSEILAHPKAFNVYASTLESMTIIAGIIFMFFQIAQGTNTQKNVFYISGVLLFYFVSNIIYFAIRGFLEMDALIFVSIIHVWINALCNLLYALILWKASRSNSLLLA